MKSRSFLRPTVVLLATVLAAGCAVQKPTLEAKADEAVVVAKFQIRYNGDDVTDGAGVLFDEHVWGSHGASVPNDGWVIAKLPLGTHHLDRIGFSKFPAGQFHYDFSPEQTAFTTDKGGRVYYVGHVRIDWNGQSFKASQFFGAVGAIVDQMANDGVATVTVTDDLTDVRSALLAKFGTDVALEKALVPSITAEAVAAVAKREEAEVQKASLSSAQDFRQKLSDTHNP